MVETFIDYVVRSGDFGWTVWQRTYDPCQPWLQTREMSTHDDREDADLEMRELNLMHAWGVRDLLEVREPASQAGQPVS